MLAWLFEYLRPLLKLFLRIFTGLCELQRICYGMPVGASRTKQVEDSLKRSRNIHLRTVLYDIDRIAERGQDFDQRQEISDFVEIVKREKSIKNLSNPEFGPRLRSCILQIWCYRMLSFDIERLRNVSYDSNNAEHERKLLLVWETLVPDAALTSRISKQWQDIGFQGDDPKTDFRGMGLLGLENLLYFVKKYGPYARQLLVHSQHPKSGYTFAIVGINITALAYRLVRKDVARSHFYNASLGKQNCIELDDFHEFYCYLFLMFDRYWISNNPQSIMDFHPIYQRFEAIIQEKLELNEALCRVELAIQNV